MPTASQPLTIAYRGNFRVHWTTESHVSSSLESLGHRVVRLQEDEVSWPDTVAAVAAEGADMLLWQRTWQIDPEGGHEALSALRAAGTPTAAFHLDRYIGLDREAQIPEDPFWRTDVVFTADGGHDAEFAAYGVNHRYLPPAIHEAEARLVGRKRRNFPHQVIFVGSHPYPHVEWEPYRSELIRRLQARYRGRFSRYPRGRAAIRGQALSDLYASATVVVGDSCLVPNPDGTPCRIYSSDRAPETVGRGGFLIHPRVEGITDGTCYTEGEHLACYDLGNWDELIDTIDGYLADPGEAARIGAAGQAHVLAEHTYAHRMRSVLASLTEQGLLTPRPQVVAISPTATPTALPASQAPATATRPLRAVRGRWRATFDVRTGEPEDARVVAECWDSNDYQVPPAGFRGTVLDIGANIGAFTVLAARAGATRVIAVEPEPGNRARLEHHVRVNRLEAVVTIVPLAVVADDTVTPTVGMVGGGGGAHLDPAGDGLVGTTTLAKLLTEHGPVELCKFDAEAAEYAAFSTVTAALLSEHVQRISLESHGPGMPTLTHLDDDGKHLERWGAMVALLADCGHLEIHGHPSRGGLMFWRRF